MAESLGARLRHQREQQKIELTVIAEQTKINISLLEGLERDDVSQWPTGIFRRSFVRDYARMIGLDPDLIVREFLALHPDHVEAVREENAGVAEAGARPPMRLRYVVSSAINSIRAKLQGTQGAAISNDSHESVVHQVVQARTTARIPSPAAPPAGTAHAPAPAPIEPPASVAPVDPGGLEPAVLELSVVGSRPEVEPPARTDTLEASPTARFYAELDRGPEGCGVEPLLDRATRVLDATGLVVWIWDPHASVLRPAHVHGYPAEIAERLPAVEPGASNATAASFRAAEMRVVPGGEFASGAVVAPLVTPAGCIGVLAIELKSGDEQEESVRDLAATLAAQLAVSVPFLPFVDVPRAVNT